MAYFKLLDYYLYKRHFNVEEMYFTTNQSHFES